MTPTYDGLENFYSYFYLVCPFLNNSVAEKFGHVLEQTLKMEVSPWISNILFEYGARIHEIWRTLIFDYFLDVFSKIWPLLTQKLAMKESKL